MLKLKLFVSLSDEETIKSKYGEQSKNRLSAGASYNLSLAWRHAVCTWISEGLSYVYNAERETTKPIEQQSIKLSSTIELDSDVYWAMLKHTELLLNTEKPEVYLDRFILHKWLYNTKGEKSNIEMLDPYVLSKQSRQIRLLTDKHVLGMRERFISSELGDLIESGIYKVAPSELKNLNYWVETLVNIVATTEFDYTRSNARLILSLIHELESRIMSYEDGMNDIVAVKRLFEYIRKSVNHYYKGGILNV